MTFNFNVSEYVAFSTWKSAKQHDKRENFNQKMFRMLRMMKGDKEYCRIETRLSVLHTTKIDWNFSVGAHQGVPVTFDWIWHGIFVKLSIYLLTLFSTLCRTIFHFRLFPFSSLFICKFSLPKINRIQSILRSESRSPFIRWLANRNSPFDSNLCVSTSFQF